MTEAERVMIMARVNGSAPADTTIRVLLVDDHTIVRQGVRALLSGVPDVWVVGEAASGEEALPLIDQLHPDVIIMDLEMPGAGGLSTIRQLAERDESPRILVLTMHPETEALVETLEAGASGYLMKDAAETDLVDAIRTVARNNVYVRPHVARLLAASLRPSSHGVEADEAMAKLERLSDREQTVLRLIAEGYNGPEIGRKLGITSKTVVTYKQRIETKLGLSHRSDFIRFALTTGLLSR
jgi:two-component system, NarL family, response regulator NreC